MIHPKSIKINHKKVKILSLTVTHKNIHTQNHLHIILHKEQKYISLIKQTSLIQTLTVLFHGFIPVS